MKSKRRKTPKKPKSIMFDKLPISRTSPDSPDREEIKFCGDNVVAITPKEIKTIRDIQDEHHQFATLEVRLNAKSRYISALFESLVARLVFSNPEILRANDPICAVRELENGKLKILYASDLKREADQALLKSLPEMIINYFKNQGLKDKDIVDIVRRLERGESPD